MKLMENIRVIFLFFLSLFQMSLVAVPAGVLPYAQFQDKTVILLGMDCHRKGYWIDFGGKSNRRETPIETAAREFSEETMFCFIPSVADVKKMLKLSTPIIVSSGYHMYPLLVPFLPNINKIQHVLRARHHIKGLPGSGYAWLMTHHIEKIDYAWVFVDALKEALANSHGNPKKVILKSIDGRSIKLHELLAGTLGSCAGQKFLLEL
jgi:8-oxo-dGTP pyrophosphatase MutT (NUDIX family)